MSFTFAPPTDGAIPLHLLAKDDVALWTGQQDDHLRNWIEVNGFTGVLGSHLVIPDSEGAVRAVVVGYGDAASRERSRFHLAAVAQALPEGTYQLKTTLEGDALTQEMFGWLMSEYKFTRYAGKDRALRKLIAPRGIKAETIEALAGSEALTRDLINTPAADMGPSALETAARTLADDHNAAISVVTGDALLDQNFPMIHAVGRAAADAPRLIDMRWGHSGPQLTLVGKGVCFDTGGLNLKPGASMGLMKKDMGGAANVLGLARAIMATGLRIRLRVLIPAVENAVSGNAFRPQDILTSRKGLSVEINNTDAEGRLVLADALALASEESPDLMISMATLTGAARVAVGPDLAPFFTDDELLAIELEHAAKRVADPVWRLPFWAPYETMIEPGIADLDNAPKGGFAGSITAALFLRRFVDDTLRYVHFDIYGWQPTAAPARPKGGVGQGFRAIYDTLPQALNL